MHPIGDQRLWIKQDDSLPQIHDGAAHGLADRHVGFGVAVVREVRRIQRSWRPLIPYLTLGLSRGL